MSRFTSVADGPCGASRMIATSLAPIITTKRTTTNANTRRVTIALRGGVISTSTIARPSVSVSEAPLEPFDLLVLALVLQFFADQFGDQRIDRLILGLPERRVAFAASFEDVGADDVDQGVD